jgi:hypothetical protein
VVVFRIRVKDARPTSVETHYLSVEDVLREAASRHRQPGFFAAHQDAGSLIFMPTPNG